MVTAAGDRPGAEGEQLIADVEPAWGGLGRYGPANLLVTALQVLAWAALLVLIDDTRLPWGLRAGSLVMFCLLMQGVFSMLHEFCHRNAYSDLRLNYLIGWVSSTLFGTAPTLLRVQHWGHHRRNRSEAERVEFIHPGESAPWKRLQYYTAILGGIWLGCFLVPLVAPLIPYRASHWLARNQRYNTFAAGFGEFKPREWRALQLEGLGLMAVWAAVVWLGPWRWQTLAVAYAAFAFSWSSLQWIYHMHTPLHVIEGAYNARAPWLVRVLFLNFNYNLTHHRHPAMPWQELHRHSDLRETQPIWYRYLVVLRPPVRFPSDLCVLEKRHF